MEVLKQLYILRREIMTRQLINNTQNIIETFESKYWGDKIIVKCIISI